MAGLALKFAVYGLTLDLWYVPSQTLYLGQVARLALYLDAVSILAYAKMLRAKMGRRKGVGRGP